MSRPLLRLLTTLAITLFSALILTAEDFTVDGIKYYGTPEGSANVVGYEGRIENLVIPETVNGRPVKYISAEAFKKCLSLRTVSAKSVTFVSKDAFNGCEHLKSVDAPAVKVVENSAFNNCPSLETVTLGDLTRLGGYTFANCSRLRELKLSCMVAPEKLGTDFYNVEILTVVIPLGAKGSFIESWGAVDFRYRTVKSDYRQTNITLTEAGTLIDKVDIDKINDIWNLKISGELNSTDLVLLNKLSNIERLDLSGAKIVASEKPYYTKGTTEYKTDDDTFGPYSLRILTLDSLALPAVTTVLENAVTNANLTYLIVPEAVTTLEAAVEATNNAASVKCGRISNLIIAKGESRLNISESLLTYATPVSVYFGRPVWGDETTSYLLLATSGETLENLTIDFAATMIPKSFMAAAFYKIKEIRIPGTVTQVSGAAFAGCLALEKIYLPNPEPPTVVANSFNEEAYANATLYVPVGSRKYYFIDDVWGRFNIEEYDPAGISDAVAAPGTTVRAYDLGGVLRYSGDGSAMRDVLPRGIYIIRHTDGTVSKTVL